MLHITNGDHAAEGLRASGISGAVLPWRDVLHEGPVPGGLTLEGLSAVRARFLSEAGLAGSYERVSADFRARDTLLRQSDQLDEVVLWFEHDLYDQLQLVQILDWFAEREGQAPRVTLICVGAFPGYPAFHGLGELRPDELASLFPQRHVVSTEEFGLAQTAWAAFRSPEPTAVERVLAMDTAPMPFLRAALLRFLEEYPAVAGGLARTERELLLALDQGAATPHAIFTAWQSYEEQRFMGDTPLWWRLRQLTTARTPLAIAADGGPLRMPDAVASQEFADQRITLTDVGRSILANQTDALALNGIDRWLGGVHLSSAGPLWRWERQSQRLVRI